MPVARKGSYQASKVFLLLFVHKKKTYLSLMIEPSTQARVTVTFLTMPRAPVAPPAPLPANARFVRVDPISVTFYRYLYREVGGEYLWWMRRAESDARLASILENPLVSVFVLTLGEEPVGIAELDNRQLITVNIGYFGLMKHTIGRGLGVPFLQATLEQAWSRRPRAVTVNTCTADHPRAMPAYLKAGFEKIRSVDEVWDIPDRLGLHVPDHLRLR